MGLSTINAPTSKYILPCASFMKDNAIKIPKNRLRINISWIITCFCFLKNKKQEKNCIKFCNDNFLDCKRRRVAAELVRNSSYHSYEIVWRDRIIHLRDSAIVHIDIIQHNEVRLIHTKISNIIMSTSISSMNF